MTIKVSFHSGGVPFKDPRIVVWVDDDRYKTIFYNASVEHSHTFLIPDRIIYKTISDERKRRMLHPRIHI